MKFLRNLFFILVVLVALVLGAASIAGYTPRYLLAAPGVGTGIGAKLLCSARFVSDFPPEQAFEDLVQYSPILANLTIDYDESARSVTTSLYGLSETTAVYQENLGCVVEYDAYETPRAPSLAYTATSTPLDTPTTSQSADLQDTSALWPAGDRVAAPLAPIQSLVEELMVDDNAAGLNTRALLVVHEGEIVAETYAQNADEDTPLLGWSMAKSLMSVMLGNLEYRGLLSLDQGPGFDAWARDRRGEIRLHHLLTMTDGLDFEEQYNPGDNATAMLFTEPSASDYAMRRPLAHNPGTYNNYSSGTANILSRVYFEATGGSLQASHADYLANIARPLGFTDSVFEVDASGVFVGSSYFYASARDWARIGLLMLNNGEINGQRVVSEDWVRRATSPNSSVNDKAYGYQWWLNRGNSRLRWQALPDDAFAAQGNRQQWLMVVPSRKAVIVRLGWTAGRYPANERFAQILEALVTL